MPGPNTTGTPNTRDYNLGRGVIYLAVLTAAGQAYGWRDVGNAPEFKLTMESETLEHKSSRSGLKSTDAEVVIDQSATCSFSLDEINHENLADFFSGDKNAPTNSAVAGFAQWSLIPTLELKKGYWYDIRSSTGVRAYDVDPTKLTLKTSNAVPVTLVENTDYTLDTETGRFFILTTSTVVDTAITNGEDITATLTADAGAHLVDEVRILTKTTVKVALKFVASNPANNDAKTELQLHQISLKANGDFNLISDDWTVMPFTGKAEKNTTLGGASSPTGFIRNVRAA